VLLLNENKGQKLRGIAAAYYAHVCSLDLPIFDATILELRTLFFFRCFEEQCKSFKALTKDAEQITVEMGHIVGQWYVVDARIFKPADRPHEETTVSGKTASSRPTARNGILKGSLYFFLGIMVDRDDTKKSSTRPGMNVPDSARFVPLTLAAQLNDLRRASDTMAEIAVQLEEAQRFDSAESPATPIKESVDLKHRRKSAVKVTKTVELPTAGTILKGEGQKLLHDAENRWRVAVQYAETVINKSNRITSLLTEQKINWPAQVQMSSIDMGSANALARLFNVDYGISENAIRLVDWLASNAIDSSTSLARSATSDP
jgi:hypothetical protein